MAKFNVVGLEEVEKKMLRREKAAAEAVPEMLKAGAAVLVKAQSDMVKSMFRSKRSKGTLADSIKATPIISSSAGASIDVYPHGDQPHGTPAEKKKGRVSNAQVGFILEYGRSNMPACPWMSTANEMFAGDVHAAMRKAWEEKQNG